MTFNTLNGECKNSWKIKVIFKLDKKKMKLHKLKMNFYEYFRNRVLRVHSCSIICVLFDYTRI